MSALQEQQALAGGVPAGFEHDSCGKQVPQPESDLPVMPSHTAARCTLRCIIKISVPSIRTFGTEASLHCRCSLLAL